MTNPSRPGGQTFARAVRAAVVLLLATTYLLSVFRFPRDIALKWGLGDFADPYFINYLLEHWYDSVKTFSDPASPPMYFPVRGTLGYSHGLILYAPFYIVVRPFLHPFQAYSAALFLVMEMGAICLYLFFRKVLELRFVESLLLSASFVSSENVMNPASGVWSQRLSVFLIPPILLLAGVSSQMSEGRPRLFLAGLSGLLATLLFTQDFYTAGFAVLLSALILAGILPLLRTTLADTGADLTRIVRAALAVRGPGRPTGLPSRWWAIVSGLSLVATGIVLIHPVHRLAIGPWTLSARDATRPLILGLFTGGWFLLRQSRWGDWVVRQRALGGAVVRAVITAPANITPPVSEQAAIFWRRGRPWVLAAALGGLVGGLLFLWIYLPAYREHPLFPADQLVGNLVRLELPTWRGLFDFLRELNTYQSHRPFALVFLIGLLAWVPMRRVDRIGRLSALWMMAVAVMVLLFAVRFDGFSLWKTFLAPLPGLSIIRDPKRIIYVYELAVVLVTGLFLSRLPARSVLRVGVSLVVALVIVLSWNREVFDFERPNYVFNRWVDTPIQMDGSCQSFFIKGASDRYMARSRHMWTLYGVDSMFIASSHSIPTLNGYSAWAPEHWELANPQENTYRKRVGDWIERNHLRGVCELDIDARTMTPYR